MLKFVKEEKLESQIIQLEQKLEAHKRRPLNWKGLLVERLPGRLRPVTTLPPLKHRNALSAVISGLRQISSVQSRSRGPQLPPPNFDYERPPLDNDHDSGYVNGGEDPELVVPQDE